MFFLTGNFLFAQLPAFFDLDGYKNLKFGMGEEEASGKITNYNLILHADFFETIELNKNSFLNIYKSFGFGRYNFFVGLFYFGYGFIFA